MVDIDELLNDSYVGIVAICGGVKRIDEMLRTRAIKIGKPELKAFNKLKIWISI